MIRHSIAVIRMNWFSNDFILRIIILLILSSYDVVADDDYFVDDLNTVIFEVTSIDELLKLGCEFEFFDSNPRSLCLDQFNEVKYLSGAFISGSDSEVLPDRLIAMDKASFCNGERHQRALWVPFGLIRIEGHDIATITVVYYLNDTDDCVIKFDFWT